MYQSKVKVYRNAILLRINILRNIFKVEIRVLREKLRLSQQDLAEKTGIPKGRINNWEQGKGSPKAQDYQILTEFFSKSEIKESQFEYKTKEPDYSEELRLLIKNIDRMGQTNEYLLARVRDLESQLYRK